jgi:ATP-binding cassette subfamily F protein uup
MDTLDLLEDLLADYEGTLILVSHDRDFIDRLATSTIGLDGKGRAIETPGGWQDFIAQNPGFFARLPVAAFASARTAPPPPAPRPKPAASAKLTYKDQRRLEELDALIAGAPARIAALEARLADPVLYSRDPAAFQDLSRDLETVRTQLIAAEEEWLVLEERREALEAGR